LSKVFLVYLQLVETLFLNKKILIGTVSDCYMDVFRFGAYPRGRGFSTIHSIIHCIDAPLINRREKILRYRQKYNKYNIKVIK